MTAAAYRPDPDEVVRLAQHVARNYARLGFEDLAEDMHQQACLKILQMAAKYDPSRGVPFGYFVLRAAARSVSDLLWRTNSPVSGGLASGDSEGRRRNLAHLQRRSLDLNGAIVSKNETDAGCTCVACIGNKGVIVDQVVVSTPHHDSAWRAQVRARAEVAIGGSPYAAKLRDVLLGEERVLRRADLTTSERRAVRRALARARRDPAMRRLWQERINA